MAAIDQLERLLARYEGMAETVATRIWSSVQQQAEKAEQEMIKLEDQMSVRRDWLDTHRDDAKWQKRWESFFDKDVRLHARYGDALERYAGRLIGERRAAYWWQSTEPADGGTVAGPEPADGAKGGGGRDVGREGATDGSVVAPEPRTREVAGPEAKTLDRRFGRKKSDA